GRGGGANRLDADGRRRPDDFESEIDRENRGRHPGEAQARAAEHKSPGRLPGGVVNHSLPHSREAEMALLGSALVGGAPVVAELSDVAPDDFYLKRHGAIWAAM